MGSLHWVAKIFAKALHARLGKDTERQMKPLPPAFSFERIMISNAILMSQGKTLSWNQFEKKFVFFFSRKVFFFSSFSFPLTWLHETPVGIQLGSRSLLGAKSYITFVISQLVIGLSIVRLEFIEGDIAYKLIKISFSEVSFQAIKRWIKFTQLIINNFRVSGIGYLILTEEMEFADWTVLILSEKKYDRPSEIHPINYLHTFSIKKNKTKT